MSATQKTSEAVATHTPGPWSFKVGQRDTQSMSEIFRADDKDFRIGFATCEFRNEQQRQEDIANARLIATAPDLLESAVQVLRLRDQSNASLSEQSAAFIALRSAVHRATNAN